MAARRGAQRLATYSRLFSQRLGAISDTQAVNRSRAALGFRRADGDAREVARVTRALRVGSGHVVVTASDIDRAEDLVEAAISAADPYRVLWVSATTDGIVALAGDVLAFAAERGPQLPSMRERVVSPTGALIAEARAAAKPVVVVVADADLASVKRLEALRIQLDAAPGAIDVVRMVLIGCPVLSRILELPSARGLSSRVGMQVRLAERTTRRRAR